MRPPISAPLPAPEPPLARAPPAAPSPAPKSPPMAPGLAMRRARSLPAHWDDDEVAATGIARGALATVRLTAGRTRAVTGAEWTTEGIEGAAMTGAAGRSMYAVVTPVSSEAAVAIPMPAVTILPSGFMVWVPPL